MNNKVKDLANVISSNLLVTIVGTLTNLIIPLVIEPLIFGYWQLYLLYAAYVGLVTFGYCDGIYLKHGGTEYEAMDKMNLSTQFYFFSGYLLVFSIISVYFIHSLVMGFEKKFALFAVAACMIIQCSNSFFVLINQATARFKVYSISNIIERSIFFIAVITMLITSQTNYYLLVIASLLSKIAVLVYNLFNTKNIIFLKPRVYRGFYKDVISNIRAGFPLAIWGIVSMFMIGFGMMYVENKLGVLELAFYAFSYSSLSVILQIITSVSMVFYPMLKNVDNAKMVDFEVLTGRVIELMTPVILMFYYALVIVINLLLPKYEASLPILLLMLPITVFQCKINIIYNNLYKVNRKEKELLILGIISVVTCVILTIFIFGLNQNSQSIALATSFAFLIWYLILKFYYQKGMFKIQNEKLILLISLFIIINLNFSIKTAFVITLILISSFYFVKRKELEYTYTTIKNIIIK